MSPNPNQPPLDRLALRCNRNDSGPMSSYLISRVVCWPFSTHPEWPVVHIDRTNSRWSYNIFSARNKILANRVRTINILVLLGSGQIHRRYLLHHPNRCGRVKVHKSELQDFPTIIAYCLDAIHESTQLSVEPRPQLPRRTIDITLELMSEDEQSNTLEAPSVDATEGVREGLDEEGAEFQFSESLQGL